MSTQLYTILTVVSLPLSMFLDVVLFAMLPRHSKCNTPINAVVVKGKGGLTCQYTLKDGTLVTGECVGGIHGSLRINSKRTVFYNPEEPVEFAYSEYKALRIITRVELIVTFWLFLILVPAGMYFVGK